MSSKFSIVIWSIFHCKNYLIWTRILNERLTHGRILRWQANENTANHALQLVTVFRILWLFGKHDGILFWICCSTRACKSSQCIRLSESEDDNSRHGAMRRHIVPVCTNEICFFCFSQEPVPLHTIFVWSGTIWGGIESWLKENTHPTIQCRPTPFLYDPILYCLVLFWGCFICVNNNCAPVKAPCVRHEGLHCSEASQHWLWRSIFILVRQQCCSCSFVSINWSSCCLYTCSAAHCPKGFSHSAFSHLCKIMRSQNIWSQYCHLSQMGSKCMPTRRSLITRFPSVPRTLLPVSP